MRKPDKPRDELRFAGIVECYRRGDLAAAERLARDYIGRYRKDVFGYDILVRIFRGLGRVDKAEKTIKNGLKLVAGSASAPLWNLHGEIRQFQGDFTGAEKAYKKVALCDKASGLGHYHLGLLYAGRGELERARQAYRESLRRQPDYAAAHNNLGLLALDASDFGEAESCFEAALASDEKYHQAWHNLSHVRLEYPLGSQSVGGTARDCIKRALSLSPQRCAYYVTAAKHSGALGDSLAALDYYRQALDLSFMGDSEVSRGDIWRSLVKYKHYDSLDDSDIRAIQVELRQSQGADEAGKLCFALAKIYEDLGDYSTSEQYYLRANGHIHEHIHGFQGRDYLEFLRRQAGEAKTVFEVLGSSLLDSGDGGEGDERGDGAEAVFIVGTMRCGSSLLEQILSSHSDIFGGGEVNHFAVALVQGGYDISDPLASMTRLTDSGANLRGIAENYLRRLGYFFRNETYRLITDKQLDNFMHIGMIRLILPRAKIIWCRRREEDAALSIFCNYFSSQAHPYAYDLGELAEFWRIYQDLCEYWQAQCGDKIYVLDYENLVANPRVTLQDLMGYLGVEWQESMLDFTANRRAVQTASSAQVRSAVHTASIGKADKFPNIKSQWHSLRK